ncbi:Uncharacterised protein [uncultured archaeon]|nr:Uncharacterised protein [uncultured archaeon]
MYLSLEKLPLLAKRFCKPENLSESGKYHLASSKSEMVDPTPNLNVFWKTPLLFLIRLSVFGSSG